MGSTGETDKMRRHFSSILPTDTHLLALCDDDKKVFDHSYGTRALSNHLNSYFPPQFNSRGEAALLGSSVLLFFAPVSALFGSEGIKWFEALQNLIYRSVLLFLAPVSALFGSEGIK